MSSVFWLVLSTVQSLIEFYALRYAQLTEIDVRMIAKEVRGALTSGTYGIDATKRFMSHPPSTIKTFCRRISSSVALRDLHLGQRTIPPYWPIERASIVYVNNAMRLLRTKERGLKRARDAQSGDDGDDGDNDTLPKDFVDKIDFDQTPSGTCFGFLTEDAARLCGAIAENVDCSTQHGMDPLCTVLTAPDQSKALGTPPPSVDFIVVTILKMSHAFGRNVTVPWKELYAAGPEHDLMEKSGWLLRPGQVLLWRKENVWVMSENESIIPLKTGLPARGGRKR